MTIKLSDLLNFDIKPFLFGTLFSRIITDEDAEIPEQIYVYTNFRASKAVNYTDFDFRQYSERLVDIYNRASGYRNWQVQRVSDSSMKLIFTIENNLHIPIEQINNLVHQKLMQESWLYADADTLDEAQKMFMRGYMETRGSIDLTRKYIAQDYFYNNRIELKRVQIFIDFLNIPLSYLNFNPRELQGDYVTGNMRRNTQFRINLFYYAKEIGFLNEYKALIFEKGYKTEDVKLIDGDVIYYDVLPPERNDSVSFIKYINFFSNNIYKQDLNKRKVEHLRKNLGLDQKDNVYGHQTRNQTIISLFDEIAPDKCGICGTTETFLRKKTGRQAFEIHHVIPFHKGKQYDNIANLVKLCPTCHDSLKKGRAPKEQQIEHIILILHNHPEIYEYTSSMLGIEPINELAREIYTMLG